MPDMTMCSGEGCPLQDKCDRVKSEPSICQSYFMTPPYENDKCMYFIDSKNYSKKPRVINDF